MIELVPRIVEHLAGLPRRLGSFKELEYQSEGWFKTELLLLLGDLKAEGVIGDFEREASFGTRQKVDVAVTTREAKHWVELKHWLIGKQKGTTYGARFYFTDKRPSGLMSDVEKLRSIGDQGRRWLLVLLTANPGSAAWKAALSEHDARPDARPLVARTDPGDFPDAFFLGLLEVLWGRAPRCVPDQAYATGELGCHVGSTAAVRRTLRHVTPAQHNGS